MSFFLLLCVLFLFLFFENNFFFWNKCSRDLCVDSTFEQFQQRKRPAMHLKKSRVDVINMYGEGNRLSLSHHHERRRKTTQRKKFELAPLSQKHLKKRGKDKNFPPHK